MKYPSLCCLALALLCGPLHAVTRSGADVAAAPVVRQGTINGRGAVESAGRTYAVSGQTEVFDRKGAPLAAPQLAPGRTVAFTTSTDSVPKARQLWLID